jgi:hypothetical protein
MLWGCEVDKIDTVNTSTTEQTKQYVRLTLRTSAEGPVNEANAAHLLIKAKDILLSG